MAEQSGLQGSLELEFTIEPFIEAQPGQHVEAAYEACARIGVEVEVGPFGSRVTGREDTILAALDAVTRSALRSGASRISTQVRRRDE